MIEGKTNAGYNLKLRFTQYDLIEIEEINERVLSNLKSKIQNLRFQISTQKFRDRFLIGGSKPMKYMPSTGYRSRAAVSVIAAALILSGCATSSPTVPATVTPYGAAPTPADAVPTATVNAEKTAAAGDLSAAKTATVAAESGGASQAVAADPSRPFSGLSPEARSNIGNAPPPIKIDVTKKLVATIKTSKGEIKVELDPTAAPQTVNNFVYLAQNGFYDGLTFHRVEPNFVIQGGDPMGNGSGGPGYNIPPEIKLKHEIGAIAMARQGGPPESTPSSGSQFYIVKGPAEFLDGQYTAFGKTLSGMEVVDKIVIGDKIERIDISDADGAVVQAIPLQPTIAPTVTPVPEPASCAPVPLNVQSDDHILGKKDAAVTIIEYGDIQCPACGQLHPSLKSLMDVVSDSVRLVFRHYPLPIHDKAVIAARAVEAAASQGKFWELHDVLYEKQKEWESKTVAEITTTLKTYAKDVGVDADKMEKDMVSSEVIARVERDMKSGAAAQVQGTPALYLDGRPIPGDAFQQADIISNVKQYVDGRSKLLASNTASFNFAKADAVTEAGSKYVMKIKTSKGDIVAELDPKLAPVNVNSTVFLAQKGYYNNTPIALNDPQVGAVLFASNSVQGNPGYDCSLEVPPANTFTKPGIVGLFGNGPRSNAQLILTYTNTQVFEGRFTAIGQIVEGLDLLQGLQAATGDTKGDQIISVEVTKK